MELKKFWLSLPTGERRAFAKSCGTSEAHMNNCAYGKTVGPTLAVSIEQATHKAVTRPELRPNDWHLIWPELLEKYPHLIPKEADKEAA